MAVAQRKLKLPAAKTVSVGRRMLTSDGNIEGPRRRICTIAPLTWASLV